MNIRWTKIRGLGPIISEATTHGLAYPTPINFSYMYGFGFLALICLVIQIVTGIFLAMHYVPNVDLAFSSVEHIMRDVNNGWLLRYMHANGASAFFIVVYLHIFRGLFYCSYAQPRAHLWCSGVAIFLIMMGTGFMGYVLPWGQMSLWGATVITNLGSAIPLIGDSVVQWFWGGFSVDNATLNRIFSIHYLMPFILVGLVGVHILLLHDTGSTNPLGSESVNYLPFHPYFWVKDFLGLAFFLLFFSILLFFFPNLLGHPDNYIPANPMVTPPHIVPEWYFLPYYAVLRSIPDKLGGVVAMLASILVMMVLPWINTAEVRSSYFRPLYRVLVWVFIINGFVLGWIGGNVVEFPYVEIGMTATFLHFFIILVMIPGVGILENHLNRSPVNSV
jgi:ubiquinol-cytochrome c reductase cytochrome b subunit